jgi:hypothetical protein
MPFTDKERAQVHAEIDWAISTHGQGAMTMHPGVRRAHYERIDREHAENLATLCATCEGGWAA